MKAEIDPIQAIYFHVLHNRVSIPINLHNSAIHTFVYAMKHASYHPYASKQLVPSRLPFVEPSLVSSIVKYRRNEREKEERKGKWD